jgi:hypothetical protein
MATSTERAIPVVVERILKIHQHIDSTNHSTYNMHMKPVQVLFDDELLAELDTDAEVQRVGRSKVLRGLAAEYLEQRRTEKLDAQYAAGYGGDACVSEELTGWEEEGEWPDE